MHFDDNVQQYNIEDAEQYDNVDDYNDEFQRTFLLDSGANPSHIHKPYINTNHLKVPVNVSTPNGSFSVSESTTVTMHLLCGDIHDRALVNPKLQTSLISPLHIIAQVGPIVLTYSKAAILTAKHKITQRAIKLATPIARVDNGIFKLTLPRPNDACAMGSRIPSKRTKRIPAITPRTPLNTIVLPTNTKQRKPQNLVGISSATKCRPILKAIIADPSNRLYYDYHLLMNHASPRAILNNIRNLKLQMDHKLIPNNPVGGLSCQPCADAKMRAAPHKRKQHQYSPGEAISSDVAGPLNFGGQRMSMPYFVICTDTATRFAFCIPRTDRTKVLPFIQDRILEFMSIFNIPPAILVSDNAKEYVSK